MFDKALFKLDGAAMLYAVCALFALVDAALVIMQACMLSTAIVSVWEGSPLTSQTGHVCAFAACFVCRGLLRSVEESFMEAKAHSMVSQVRGALLGKLFDNGPAMKARFGSASISNVLVEGSQKVERYISAVVPKTVSMIVVPLCIAAFVFTQDWLSGVIVVVCYPFIIAFMRLIGYTASDESARRRRGFDEMSNHFLDALRGMGTLRSFGVSKAYSKSVLAASERYRGMVMKTLRIAQLSGAVLDIFATCGLAAVAIMLGFRMVEGTLAFLPALIVLMLVPEYFMPIKSYASDYHASLEGRSALSSMVSMMETKPGSVSLGALELSVSPGETVVLEGRSGSGKTTVLDALAGLVDVSNGIARLERDPDGEPREEDASNRVGAIGGEQAGLGEFESASRVAYIPQAPYIFPGSLLENVSFYNPRCSEEDAERALRLVGLGGMLDEMPEGISTCIGRGGRGISGGQARRVAIARALADPSRDVWLLDEPGASLDEWSERDLLRTVMSLKGGRTLVVASHERMWEQAADRVIDVGAMEGVAHV